MKLECLQVEVTKEVREWYQKRKGTFRGIN